MAHIAAAKIGLNTQQDTTIGLGTTAATASRGAKVLGFIGFGLDIAGTAALTGYDPIVGSFLDSTPVLVPQKGGTGFATATPAWSTGVLSWTLA
jgi:hypothetical protein